MRNRPGLLFILILCAGPAGPVFGQAFEVDLASPALDRWMYPHNATPGSRPTAPVFGTLGDDSGVDSRHGQLLLGFELGAPIGPALPPDRYLLRECVLTLTVSRDRSFLLDPTRDAAATYLPTGHPDALPDPDPGRPLELFGAGFRNGFTAATFLEDSPFGSPALGRRNAFAAGPDPAGALVDVGNSVGKTNAAFPPFEAHPFAVGRTDAVAPGEPVPAGTTLEFALNLADPQVTRYLQEACHTGRLRLILTSLQTSGFGGQPAWAEFHTRESVLGAPPSLRLTGTRVRPDDTDGDGLPDDWERHFFADLTAAGPGAADADRDGATDREEWEAGTDPARDTEHLALTLILVRPLETGPPATRVRFRPAASRRYVLQGSEDLKSWAAVDGAVLRHEVGTGWAGFEVNAGGASGCRFLRVAAGLEPAPEP